MQPTQLERLTLHACHAVRDVAEFLRREVGQVQFDQIEEKHLNGLVSYVDRTAEEMLVERLGKLLPEAEFVTEEGTVENKAGDLQWIIDPLDGTTNFLYGVPHYSISVGLREEGHMISGIVHHVPRNELFHAWQGGGAWCNERRIHASPRKELRQALVSTGFPYHNLERLKEWLKAMEVFVKEGRGVRRFGSAALDLAYVACGRFDVFFEYGLNAWDVAGGALLVQEAGGRVSDFLGGEKHIDGGEILATNGALYEPVLSIIQRCFRDDR